MNELEISAQQARELTDKIKVGVEAIWDLVKQAYVSRAWSVLGYDSWDDYCTREFGTSRIRLPREERQEVVSSMREIGMSTRAIASATGTNRETIRQELAGGNKLSPESEPVPVVGTDGKTYTPRPTQQNTPTEKNSTRSDPEPHMETIEKPKTTPAKSNTVETDDGFTISGKRNERRQLEAASRISIQLNSAAEALEAYFHERHFDTTFSREEAKKFAATIDRETRRVRSHLANLNAFAKGAEK